MEHKEALNEPVTAPGSLSKPEKPGVPQEKSVAGNKKTAIAVITAIVLACVLLAVALGILISRLSRIDWKMLLNDTDPDSVQVTNSAKTETTGNRIGDEPGDTKPADAEPDDPDSLALQAKDAEDWMKVAWRLRDDFIEEDAVFLDSELVSQDWYEVSLKYFFPSFQETSSVGCGYLVQIHNRSQYKHAFIFDCYQANSWMIEGSDIVEINGYESKTVFLCLDEMYVRTVTVRHAIESIGFRLMIRPGGYSGANNMFDEFFSFLLNGRAVPKRLNVPEGPIVFDDKGILVVHTYSNLDTIETSEPYISTSYFIRNNNDYPLDVKLFGYIDGCYVGQIDTDDHRIVTAQCDLFDAGVAINKPKLDRAGIEIQDGIKNFSVRMVVEACPGYVLDVPEEPLLDTTFVIFEAGGKT